MDQRAREENPTFSSLLKRYRLRNIVGREPWRVESESGGVYSVRRVSRVDRGSGSFYWVWRCDCPARYRCRHVDAVEDLEYCEAMVMAKVDPEAGQDLIKVLERTD